jgi:F1F0 ATPase subunit 2
MIKWVIWVVIGIFAGGVYFGGLWLTVRRLIARPRSASVALISGTARLAMLGITFYLLSTQGAGGAMAGLGGLCCARWYLLRRLGGRRHAG